MIRSVRCSSFKSLQKAGIDLRSITVPIGANAAGKSNVVRGLRFLAEAIRADVETAIAPLGGIEGACFWGGAREFALGIDCYVPDPTAPHSRSDMSYRLLVGEHEGRALVLEEELRTKRRRDEPGRAKVWLRARRGRGEAVRDPQATIREAFDTGDPGVLALKAVGFLETYPRIRALRRFVESWQFLAVSLEAIRAPRRDMRADRLDFDAANLVNVLRTVRDTPVYAAILEDLHNLIDTVEGVGTAVDRGRVTLLLKERPFPDPVEALSVSDGTLRLLALLAALHLMPDHCLLCVEDPKRGIHPLVFGPLLDSIRERCPEDGARQVVLTTHSPDLVDAAQPREVVTVERDATDQTVLERPDPARLHRWVQDFRLGGLWRMRQPGGVPA
ncbi:MAG: AAA family ATPase [Candidatus Latescibacterota bacterium]